MPKVIIDITMSLDGFVTGRVPMNNMGSAMHLIPRTARTIDLAVGERHEGPILRRRDGRRLDRRTAHR